MLLAIDVGNTNMMVGVYQQDKLLQHWRLETQATRTADEFGIFFKELFQFAKLSINDVKTIIISNVVPTLEFSLERMCERYFKQKPTFVSVNMKLPIKIGLKHPEEIGADRIVNAVAGVQQYGAPLIIVDFGTATTFDYIDGEKIYQGGCITPGITVSNEALFQRASKLPRVEIKKPERLIGQSTIESIQAGIFYGYVGMVDSIVDNMKIDAQRNVGKNLKKEIKVVATGGFLSLITQGSKSIQEVSPFLTLEGLKILATR